MKLVFRTMVDDLVTEQEVPYIKEDNKICFYIDDIKTSFIILSDGLKLIRDGKIKQEILFIPKKITKTVLEDEFNLQMEFFVYTELVKCTLNGIYIKYSLFAGQEKISMHKIWLKYLANTSKID